MLKFLAGLVTRPIIRNLPFRGSADYWENRYRLGGDSGKRTALDGRRRKAEFINRFVSENNVRSVIEFGCGDGWILELAEYPKYFGFDVSKTAVRTCRRKFRNDPSKQFRLLSEYEGETADLALSLDVIYHLVEDDVFDAHMRDVFGAAERFVLIRSTDFDGDEQSPHVRHRAFTGWVGTHAPEFRLREQVASGQAGYFIYERQ